MTRPWGQETGLRRLQCQGVKYSASTLSTTITYKYDESYSGTVSKKTTNRGGGDLVLFLND